MNKHCNNNCQMFLVFQQYLLKLFITVANKYEVTEKRFQDKTYDICG